jgi:hypothetical protein
MLLFSLSTVVIVFNFQNARKENVQTNNFVSFYGCETRSVTLTEEHNLHVLEKKAFNFIFGSKKDEVSNLGC